MACLQYIRFRQRNSEHVKAVIRWIFRDRLPAARCNSQYVTRLMHDKPPWHPVQQGGQSNTWNLIENKQRGTRVNVTTISGDDGQFSRIPRAQLPNDPIMYFTAIQSKRCIPVIMKTFIRCKTVDTRNDKKKHRTKRNNVTNVYENLTINQSMVGLNNSITQTDILQTCNIFYSKSTRTRREQSSSRPPLTRIRSGCRVRIQMTSNFLRGLVCPKICL